LAIGSAQIDRKVASGAALPPAEALVNSGRRRTEQKRALLRALAEAAADTGRKPPFKAKG
jgi:hypothetical protein